MSIPGKMLIDDMELARRVLAGDEAAREELYARINPFVYSYMSSLKVSGHETSDLCQTFWLIFWRRSDRPLKSWLAKPNAKLSTYLFKIIMRVGWRSLKRQGPELLSIDESYEPEADRSGHSRNEAEIALLYALDAPARRKFLLQLCSDLPSRPRLVFIAWFDGEPKEITCNKLPMEPSTYARNLIRAREELKKLVEQKRKEESR